jgi:aldehyde:ferredoxin oxidoreductase
MQRIIRVNMRTKDVTEQEVSGEQLLYGGRRLIAKILNEEVNPNCDPLGKENKLMFCTMILSGTAAPSSGRLSIGCKSPLTGTIKESNVGGMLGQMLGMHFIRAIILEDLPPDDGWWLLHIDAEGKVHLLPANEYAGKNNYELRKCLEERFGNKIATGSIGLAGERLYKNSSVIVSEFRTNHPNRAAGRGGVGSVMGSKRIKALVVSQPQKPTPYPYADKNLFLQTVKRHQQVHSSHGLMGIRQVGTAGTIANTGAHGVLPVRNFSGELFEPEKLENIMPHTLESIYKGRGGKTAQRCMPGCIGLCSNEYVDKDGNYITGGLEYETIALCGSNCDISDTDVIASIDRFCDDMGMDTMEFGATIGVAMDSGVIPWGDIEAVRRIMKEVKEGTDFGNLIGQGTEVFGKAIGAKRIPTVKGQSISAYDPRNSKGIGVTYATSGMGADHTAGMVLGQGGDPTKKDEKAYYSMINQIDSAMQDSFMCTFNWGSAITDITIITDYVKGALGIELTEKDLIGIAVDTLELEDKFNKAAGFKKEDDDLPRFFREEPSEYNGAVFDFTLDELQEAKNYRKALEGK